jgi:CRISPR/Cas system CMR-associated protein Cmr5 small subunit
MQKPTIEQKRARFALERVESVLSDRHLKGLRKKFLIELRHLPANLHWGGLGQAAASLLADPKNEPRMTIYKWLEDWLRQSGIYRVANANQPSLIQCVTGSGGHDALQDRYVAATREARAMAVWLKKFAEAFLREPEQEKSKGGDHGAAAATPPV